MKIMSYLLGPVIWMFCTGACWLVCKYRSIKVTMVQCLIIGGLPLALGAVPLPLPFLLQIGLGYGITVYVTMKYLEVALYPDGLLIPLVTYAVASGVPLVLG